MRSRSGRGSASEARLRPPATLREFQRWFGGATARPLLPGNKTIARGVNGARLETEANARLRTLHGMSGLERLEVYNRQYWFRLITIMQEEYPCALHVIGLDAFNAWTIRFLVANPPASPYLADMDAEFPAFLRRRYRGKDATQRAQALQAAEYDKALSRAFDGPEAPRAKSSSPLTRWTLAAHVTPLWLDWDFPAYRTLCRADEDLTGKFRLLRAGRNGRGLCLHRHDGTIYEKAITRAEFRVLEALRKPRTLDEVFRAAKRGATEGEKREMERKVGEWFREWTELGWLGGGREKEVGAGTKHPILRPKIYY